MELEVSKEWELMWVVTIGNVGGRRNWKQPEHKIK